MPSSLCLHSAPEASPKALLQKAKKGAIAAVNAKPTSEHEITLQGFPGLEFEATIDQFRMRVRMFLVTQD